MQNCLHIFSVTICSNDKLATVLLQAGLRIYLDVSVSAHSIQFMLNLQVDCAPVQASFGLIRVVF